MNTQSSLPGVSGAVTLTNHPLFGHQLRVDGLPVRREKGEYLLPGLDGSPVRAKVRGRFLSEHPIVSIAGDDYSLGNATPPFLLLIVFLPLLFLFGGNLFAVVLAVVGLGFNFWIVRTPRAEAWKVGMVLVSFAAGVVLMAAWAFISSWFFSLIRP